MRVNRLQTTFLFGPTHLFCIIFSFRLGTLFPCSLLPGTGQSGFYPTPTPPPPHYTPLDPQENQHCSFLKFMFHGVKVAVSLPLPGFGAHAGRVSLSVISQPQINNWVVVSLLYYLCYFVFVLFSSFIPGPFNYSFQLKIYIYFYLITCGFLRNNYNIPIFCNTILHTIHILY